MAQVTVTIAGRPYRMACADGEEPHLEALGKEVDRKIAELRGSFGQIGDSRITVMAALTFADEVSEAKRRISALEAENQALQRSQATAQAEEGGRTGAIADALLQAAERIEQAARALGTARDSPFPPPAGDASL